MHNAMLQFLGTPEGLDPQTGRLSAGCYIARPASQLGSDEDGYRPTARVNHYGFADWMSWIDE